MLLKEKACVITGGGRGIGRFTAEAFARAGANVALCARSGTELEETRDAIETAFGVDVHAESVDVADWEAVKSFAVRVFDRFGRVDVLLNNAGVYGPVGPIIQVDMDAWQQAVQIDLLGVVHAIRAFAPQMIAQGGGRIINLAGGGLGGRNVPTNVSAYTASKAAVVCLTETLAKELSPYSVWVNAVSPGAISTKLIDAVIKAGPELAGREFFEQSKKQREDGDPIDSLTQLMVFLASDRASKLTGKLLSAKWDKIEELENASQLNETSLYTLRRIDGVLFTELSL